MNAAATLPKLSPRAAVVQCNFIEATLHEGWCLATQNTLECMLCGNHDHALAVAPDGSYGAVHWNSLGKKLRCVQVRTGGVNCFGEFEAVFPPPIRTLPDFARPFRQIFPILQDAHRLWKAAPRFAGFERFPFSVSGDLRRDVAMAATTQKANELADLTVVMKAIYEIVRSKAPGTKTLGALQQGLSSSFQSVWTRSGSALIALSHDFPEAEEALLASMSHRKPATRLQTVQSVFTERPPLELTRRILARGLGDSSKRVRQFAASRIESFGLVEMLPEIESALEIERDPQAANALKQARSILKFGVVVEQRPDGGGYLVRVQKNDGGSTGCAIAKSRLDRKAIERAVRELNGDLELFEGWSAREVLAS